MATIDPKLFTERIIDVADKPVVARVVREGVDVPAPTIDLDRVKDLVERLKVPVRTTIPRVVSQSVPAGTRVARGTVVDLTFVKPQDIEVGVLAEVHEDLKLSKVKVSDMVTRIADPEVTRILNTRETAAELTPDEEVKIVAALPQGTVINSTPERSLQKAFSTLKSVRAFK